MKGTNEKWTVTKLNFREKVAKNVDLVHFSIGHFIYSGTINVDLVHFSIGAFKFHCRAFSKTFRKKYYYSGGVRF